MPKKQTDPVTVHLARVARNVNALRDRRRAAGLTRLELWAHPSQHAAIRKHAADLEAQRKSGK